MPDRAKAKIQKIRNTAIIKPKPKPISPTRGATGIVKKTKTKSPPNSPVLPFCTLKYDVARMILNYDTNIDYLHEKSEFTKSISSLQKSINLLKS